MQPDQPILRHPQTTHDGASVQMALHITPRRQGNSDGREHHGQKGRQPEEALRPVQRTADFRPGILGIFQPLTVGQPGFRPSPETGQRLCLTGQQQAVTHPRPGLNQTARWNIVKMHHQPGGQAEKIDTAIRFHGQDGANRQMQLSDAGRCPRRQLQRPGQTLVQPDYTRLWATFGRRTGLTGLRADR